ncbi:MAG: hypothetical protein ACR2RL_08560 [Gammaproteobacteria bacterium]
MRDRWRLARTALLACAACIACIVSVPVAQSAEWSVRPRVVMRVEWNDNRRLLRSPDKATVGAVTRLRLNAAVRTDRGSLTLRPELSFRRFSNQKQLDSDDQALGLRADYALSERLRFNFSGRYRRDTSGQLNFDPDEPGASNQRAIIEAGSRRRRWEANPSLSYLATERLRLGLAFSYTYVMYSKGLELDRRRFDFTQSRLTAGATYALSERDTLSGSVFGGRYEAPQAQNTTDSVGGSVRYARRFTSTLEAHVSGGVYQSFFDLPANRLADDSDTGMLFDVGFTKSLQRSRLTGNYSRTLSPSSSGDLRQRDQVQMRYRYRLSETLAAKINVRAHRTERTGTRRETDADGNPVITDDTNATNVYRVRVGLEKRLNRNWRLTADYRYLLRDEDSDPDQPDSNAVFIGVVYDGDKYAVSR